MSDCHYQEGIILEDRDHAIFLEANFISDDLDAIKDAIGDFSARIRSYKTRYSNLGLSAVIAFGKNAWQKLSNEPKSATELKDLKTMAHGMVLGTQRDLFIHILSFEHKINFALANDFVTLFKGLIEIKEETHGFRNLEARDLGGFVDGTENPKGLSDRKETAIITEGIDCGGSYVIAQKWVHDLTQFNHFDLKTQEGTFGRTKQDDIEMSDEEKPIGAHTERVVIEDEAGEELEMVRQSLPYGKASGSKGLYFVGYANRLTTIDTMLKRMCGEVDGEFDRMFCYTHAITGSYLYVPSQAQLDALGE